MQDCFDEVYTARECSAYADAVEVSMLAPVLRTRITRKEKGPFCLSGPPSGILKYRRVDFGAKFSQTSADI